MADRKDWPPVINEQFVQAWLNLKELPGGMMQSNTPPHRFGPIPGTQSCVITTSPTEAETWRAAGEPVLTIYTADAVIAPTPCPECHNANGHYEGCGRGFETSAPTDGVAASVSPSAGEPSR